MRTRRCWFTWGVYYETSATKLGSFPQLDLPKSKIHLRDNEYYNGSPDGNLLTQVFCFSLVFVPWKEAFHTSFTAFSALKSPFQAVKLQGKYVKICVLLALRFIDKTAGWNLLMEHQEIKTLTGKHLSRLGWERNVPHLFQKTLSLIRTNGCCLSRNRSEILNFTIMRFI